MAKHAKSKVKAKTEEISDANTSGFFNRRTVLIVLIGLSVGYIHQYHVSALLENDRHFSHLSTLEREMSFRTEMGLYYSYFLTVIEAPTFLQGVEALYNNKVTEYPDTINTLQRFNLYPEIILGAGFRIYESVAQTMNWKTKECWKINRGDLSPVMSCEGSGDPVYFYLNGVWLCAALTMAFTFLLATEMSDSIVGGLLAVLCYFYNHGECTRVMWTPPLRESFAFPLVVAQMYLVTYIIKRNTTSKGTRTQVLGLALTTTLYMAFWQFGQFALFSQMCCLFPVYAIGLMSKDTFNIILKGQLLGLLFSLILLFGNKMLLTSWLSSSLFATYAVLHGKELSAIIKGLFSKGNKSDKNEDKKPVVAKVSENGSESSSPSDTNPALFSILLDAAVRIAMFLYLTVVFKFTFGKLLNVKDDDHILNLLRSKFSDYRDFHTLLYTCAKEFDFLGMEMPIKCTKTFLVPAVFSVLIAVVTNTVQKYVLPLWKPENPVKDEDNLHKSLTLMDPALVYNLAQMVAYGGMAAIIMRLKLFFVPQLCVVAAMLGNKKFIPVFRQNPSWHTAFLIGLVACMSVQGISNIKQQRSIIGEYSNAEFEELIEWINATIPVDASFAGPMPVMANVLLSTRRPVINHPHYEDVGIRARTKKIYQMYSRRTVKEYYETIQEMKASFLVVSKGWCLSGSNPETKCGMTDLWDVEEPERIGMHEPLCPILFEGRTSIRPFEKVFQNGEYLVLRIPDNAKELKPARKKKNAV